MRILIIHSFGKNESIFNLCALRVFTFVPELSLRQISLRIQFITAAMSLRLCASSFQSNIHKVIKASVKVSN